MRTATKDLRPGLLVDITGQGDWREFIGKSAVTRGMNNHYRVTVSDPKIKQTSFSALAEKKWDTREKDNEDMTSKTPATEAQQTAQTGLPSADELERAAQVQQQMGTSFPSEPLIQFAKQVQADLAADGVIAPTPADASDRELAASALYKYQLIVAKQTRTLIEADAKIRELEAAIAEQKATIEETRKVRDLAVAELDSALLENRTFKAENARLNHQRTAGGAADKPEEIETLLFHHNLSGDNGLTIDDSAFVEAQLSTLYKQGWGHPAFEAYWANIYFARFCRPVPLQPVPQPEAASAVPPVGFHHLHLPSSPPGSAK